MVHERSPVRPDGGPHATGDAAPPSGLWADAWRYAYWIVLDRGLASLIARWVAEAAEDGPDPAVVRIAWLSTTRRIAIGMARDGVQPRGPLDDAARIAALPRGQREVLVLRNLLGLRDTEIAAVLGCRCSGLPIAPRARGLFATDPAAAPGE